MYDTITELITSTIYHNMIGDERSSYNQLKKKIYDIENDYFKRIPTDTERLHRDLNPKLRDRVVDDFKKLVEFYLGQSYQDHLLKIIRYKIIASFPNADPQSFNEACLIAKVQLIASAKYRFDNPEYAWETPFRQVSEEGMMLSYQKAEKRTLGEIIGKLNKADVFAFYHTLLQKCMCDCQQLMNDKVLEAIENVIGKLKNQQP